MSNPRNQHRHNWVMGFTRMSGWKPTPSDPYSPGGFSARKYWKCVRGGTIKHTEQVKEVFIRASGSPFFMKDFEEKYVENSSGSPY